MTSSSRRRERLGSFRSASTSVKAEDFGALEALVQSAIKDKQKFERCIVTKENLLEMFKVSRAGGWQRGAATDACPTPVQQIQAAHHLVEDPRRHEHDGVPVWPDGGPVCRPAHPAHGPDQGDERAEGELGSLVVLAQG